MAAADDPFTTVRILRLVACIERGRSARIADIAAALDARHLDWAFSQAVVADVLVQLQSNWMADYRNGSGIVVEDGPYGPTLTIEDSSRVDPWIVRQVEREPSPPAGWRSPSSAGATRAGPMTDRSRTTMDGAPGRCMCRGRARS